MITEEPGEELPFTSVAQSQHGSYDFEGEEYFVIENQNDFEAFWEALHEGRGSTPSLPSIDFSEETVVAVLFGTKPTGGYTIKVTDVTSDGSRLHVQVEKTTPGESCGTYQAVTSPYHVIKVPVTSADFQFDASVETRSCD